MPNGATATAVPSGTDQFPERALATGTPQAPGGSREQPTTLFPPSDDNRPCVLIVEDEVPLAEALARTLGGRGFRPLLVGDVAAALHTARSARPDLIVLDLLLPDGNGLDVCRALRCDESTRSIPILITTCLDDDADELHGLTAGADDYVAKPYNLDVLIARIGKLLDRRPVVV